MKTLMQVVDEKPTVNVGEEITVEGWDVNYRVARVTPSMNGVFSLVAYRRNGSNIERLTYDKERGLKVEQLSAEQSADYWVVSSFLSKFEKKPSQKFREFLASRQ